MFKYEFGEGYPREEAAGLKPTPPPQMKSKEHKTQIL